VRYVYSFLKLKFLNKEEKKKYVFLNENPEFSKYSIGEFSYGEPKILSWGEQETLKIGKFCSIAPDVTILLSGEHRIDWITAFPFSSLFKEFQHFSGHPASKGNVTIGNDVWIGTKSLILSGVTIGDGAVIGAGSVVTKNVQPYAIVAGNPAKQIRLRFDQETIDNLLKIRWWDWDLNRIREKMPLLLSENIREFVSKNGF
jgi:virginiamycin A acetyltransferase